MPFRWGYGGPSWAAAAYDSSATGAIRLPLGADRLVSGDSESTGTYRSLRVLPGLDGDGTRHLA